MSAERQADGGTVTIRPLPRENFALAASWLADPSVNRYLTADWRGRAVDASVIAIAMRNKRNHLCQFEHDGRPSGIVAFSELETRDRSAMVWYALGDSALGGRGVTTRAVRSLCAAGFAEHALVSIWAMVLAPNGASIRLLEKVGFRPAGRLRSAECVEGRQLDRLYFDLLPGELTS